MQLFKRREKTLIDRIRHQFDGRVNNLGNIELDLGDAKVRLSAVDRLSKQVQPGFVFAMSERYPNLRIWENIEMYNLHFNYKQSAEHDLDNRQRQYRENMVNWKRSEKEHNDAGVMIDKDLRAALQSHPPKQIRSDLWMNFNITQGHVLPLKALQGVVNKVKRDAMKSVGVVPRVPQEAHVSNYGGYEIRATITFKES